MGDAPRIAALIARAIVHLNFNEPDEARDVLMDALTDFNFPQQILSSTNQPKSQSAAQEAA